MNNNGSGSSGDKSDIDRNELDRERRAGQNRLAELDVQDVSLQKADWNGATLRSKDLCVLGIVIEEEESVDPVLGLQIGGVSRRVVRELTDLESTQNVGYRFGKLEGAGLIKELEARSLSDIAHGGSAPKYAVPTTEGRELAKGTDLLPIVGRDRDLEQVVDGLIELVYEQREVLTQLRARHEQLFAETETTVDGDIEELRDEDRLVEIGEKFCQWDVDPDLVEHRFDDPLLSERSEGEQQALINELLRDD